MVAVVRLSSWYDWRSEECHLERVLPSFEDEGILHCFSAEPPVVTWCGTIAPLPGRGWAVTSTPWTGLAWASYISSSLPHHVLILCRKSSASMALADRRWLRYRHRPTIWQTRPTPLRLVWRYRHRPGRNGTTQRPCSRWRVGLWQRMMRLVTGMGRRHGQGSDGGHADRHITSCGVNLGILRAASLSSQYDEELKCGSGSARDIASRVTRPSESPSYCHFTQHWNWSTCYVNGLVHIFFTNLNKKSH